MTDDTTKKDEVQFYQLVISLQAAAMQQMGKVISPHSGKVERDMDLARSSIDMLEMLQRKTIGNLGEDEKKLLEHALYELRLNYVDELKKKPDAEPEAADNEQPAETKDESSESGASAENTADEQERPKTK